MLEKMRGFPPPLPSSLAHGRGFAVTEGDPVLTSPCVATETEELRKREEARRRRVTAWRSEGREEPSLSFYVWLSVSASVCVAFLAGADTHKSGIAHFCSASCSLIWCILMPPSVGRLIDPALLAQSSAVHKQQLVNRKDTAKRSRSKHVTSDLRYTCLWEVRKQEFSSCQKDSQPPREFSMSTDQIITFSQLDDSLFVRFGLTRPN